MKTITVSALAAEIHALLDQAKAEDVLVRTESGDEFMLTAVNDFDRKNAQSHRKAKLMPLLDERAKQKQTKTISLDEVKRRLGMRK